MMGKEWYARFSVVLLFTGCANATVQNRKPNVITLTPPPLNLRAELSSEEVVAGSIVLVKMQMPENFSAQTVIGEFEDIDLPFFAAPELGERIYAAVLGVPYEHLPGQTTIKIRVGGTKETFQ